MKRIGLILALFLILQLTACAAPTADGDAISVCPDLPETVTEESESEDAAYALVDWMIFVRYNGRSYTRDFGDPTVLPKDRIGEQLGTVTSKPPSPTPTEYVTNVPDLASFGYPIGSAFYEIEGISKDYEIAVYDREKQEYHRLCYEELLPLHVRIVRDGWQDNGAAVSLRAEVITEYALFFGRGEDVYAAYDEAFFEDNVLAVVYLEEGSGSISHEVTMVRRVGDTIEIHIRRDIPEIGTCDMAYWAVTAAISREDWDGAEIVPVINTPRLWRE